MAKLWKKGRGKLGFLDPLIGRWQAKTVSENGPVECVRVFEPVLKESYVRLTAHWKVGPAPKTKPKAAAKGEPKGEVKAGSSYTYDEVALIGSGDERNAKFWSFTSDGKHTYGQVADASDLHAEAIGFEATVMGRQARQAYWPVEGGNMIWVVETKAKKGWNRFVEHRYRSVDTAPKKSEAMPKKADEKAAKTDEKKKTDESPKKSTSS